MAQSYKICPICEASNHHQTLVCTTCGTSLSDIEIVRKHNAASLNTIDYDFRYGETDLLESDLKQKSRLYLLATFVFTVILTLACGGLIFRPYLSALLSSNDTPTPFMISSQTPTSAFGFVTVTQGPPTATQSVTPSPSLTPSDTPTPSPCIQRVLQGDSLTAIVVRCGHRSTDVIALVQEMNGIDNPAQIQVGQEIIVPWPTNTPDPNAPTVEGDSNLGVQVAGIDLSFDPFAPLPTATLPPGLTFHLVQPQENLVTIILEYETDVKILSEINPEIDFAQCDFGVRFGGSECTVILYQGQSLRVPAPTPTPTLSPTPSGSETPTPTATATFTAPSIVSPLDSSFFGIDDLVTLRWVASGGLTPEQMYRIEITDQTTQTNYVVDTQELSYILPPDWQGTLQTRHEFRWRVSVINIQNPENLLYTTRTATFTWQGNPPPTEEA